MNKIGNEHNIKSLPFVSLINVIRSNIPDVFDKCFMWCDNTIP